MMRAKFIVELEVPARSSADFVASYIQSAAKRMKGQLFLEDPMRDLDTSTVKVSIVKEA